MTGFNSKRDAAADKIQEPVDIASIIACREMLDAQPVPARSQYMIEEDDDIQVYKRPWVGLTDEEIDAWTPEIHGVIRSIEQVLKEKNGCDHTQLLEMLAYRAECFPNYPIGGHIPEVFAALGRPIPIGDLLAQPPLSLQEPDAYQSGYHDGKKAARARCIELVLAGSSMPVQTKTLEALQRDRKRIAKLIEEDGKP